MLAVPGGCFAEMTWWNFGKQEHSWRSIAAKLGIPVITALDAYRSYCTETVAANGTAQRGRTRRKPRGE